MLILVDAAPVHASDTDFEEYETTVEGENVPDVALPQSRAVSQVTREDMELRLPRSAPDALRYEPGVFIQQTAHAQGSAFIRGMTGQQTLILFDGIRMNNSTYRQGPNQYFFTLDSASIDSIAVLRGGSSTRFGSDALGGVILARPIVPRLSLGSDDAPVSVDPHLVTRLATADHEAGARISSNVAVQDAFAFYGGVGYRSASELRSGGPIEGVGTGVQPQVPRFASDGETQLGTGFNEFTADGALLYLFSPSSELKVAGYTYRQTDAPRTDQCPAAYAPWNECLMYDEQFRDLVYAAYQGEFDNSAARNVRATVSWQQQHERYTLSRPTAAAESTGKDTVNTLGVTLWSQTRRVSPIESLTLRLEYGADNYFDVVDSHAWIWFSDIDYTQERSRRKYIDGSTYLYGGAFAQGRAEFFGRFALRSGTRISWIDANADADPESGTSSVDESWFPMVFNAGLDIAPDSPVSIAINVDRSFRAPNLDDLTSRQQTGPGFQFENPELGPETATTFETGLLFNRIVSAELWGYVTHLNDAITRSPRSASDCPQDSEGCAASWNRYQLVNASEYSLIKGFEAVFMAPMPGGLNTRATIAWTRGEGPNPGDMPSDPSIDFQERVPLSRIPPLNGTVEIIWKAFTGFSAGATLRWAASQTRLAVSDMTDARIPQGGTPGFAVVDLRVSYRANRALLASLAFENVFDTAYRYHGSSVNGPGRGILFLMDIGPVWSL